MKDIIYIGEHAIEEPGYLLFVFVEKPLIMSASHETMNK